MAKIIGVLAAERIVAGLVEGNRVVGPMHAYPEPGAADEGLQGVPAEEIAQLIRRQIELAGQGVKVEAVGIGFAGIVREGRIEEAPNLQQTKGFHLREALATACEAVLVLNDADAVATGIAAIEGKLESLIRVWTLGDGIGFGRYPRAEGVWEGGHMVVSLDPKEKFCGCGGVGHLEGIMGYRSMRLRFLDMEPEEVFAHAKEGDSKCREFVDLWHRALAAGTASFIHLAGPGRFYFTGHNVGFLEIDLLRSHLESMVRMSPLQSFSLEVLPPDDEIPLIGAGVS